MLGTLVTLSTLSTRSLANASPQRSRQAKRIDRGLLPLRDPKHPLYKIQGRISTITRSYSLYAILQTAHRVSAIHHAAAPRHPRTHCPFLLPPRSVPRRVLPHHLPLFRHSPHSTLPPRPRRRARIRGGVP
ncbi:hypothetical protein B0H19DRAFT_1180621 [Mycena capillaripes]|nr:hypothetical protein B0H19DRAFT_1180621 [Mycena capillaripes]